MILILGGSGYVGQAYQSFLISRGIDFKSISRTQYNYSMRDELSRVIDSLKPEFIINAAGYTGKPNVDRAETDKTECLHGNTLLPGVIAEVCAEKKIPWGHVSSGCIYTGKRTDGSGFREEDAPNFDFRHNNCSFYSGTKALAEEILQDFDMCYLWRLRIPYNEVDSPRNYISKLITYHQLLEAENSISQLNEFVRATFACWEKRLPFGKYNVTNPGSITTSQVVEMIKKSGVVSDKEFSFFKNEETFMATAAKTPRSNCVLDSAKILSHGIQLTEVHESIAWCLKNWRPRN